ncbi:MAG: glycosyltransferase family 4 protein [Candidatus Peregrinibacteria bacterium]
MPPHSSSLITRFPLESAWGGEEAVHLLLAEHFQNKGVRPVFCGSCPVMSEAFTKKGFLTVFVPFFKDITSKTTLLFSLITLPLFFLLGMGILTGLRMNGVKKMLCMTLIEKIVWTPIAKILGMEVFWGHHAPLGKWFFKNPFLIFWKIFSRWATIIVPSEAMKQELLNSVKKTLQITVIHNPLLEKPMLSPDTQKIPLLPKGTIILGTASRFSREKGLQDGLAAYAILSQSHPQEYALFMAGDGPLRPALETQVRDKNLHNVFFFGFCNPAEMAAFWENIHIFLLPSHEEPFGMVLLEAMNAEVPIIATTVGGVPEVLENAGILIPSKNPQKMAEEIFNLAKNTTLQSTLKKMGKERVQRCFSLEMFYSTLDAVFLG